MDKEIVKIENGHDVKIALVQKDIEYIRGSITNIENKFNTIDEKFVKRDELLTAIKGMEDAHKDIKNTIELQKKDIDAKLDIKDFTPIKNVLVRINWILISAVVIALLALVTKIGSNSNSNYQNRVNAISSGASQ